VTVPYHFIDVLNDLSAGGPLYAIMLSEEYRRAIGVDFAALADTPEAADAFFARSQIENPRSGPTFRAWAWGRLLSILRDADPGKYDRIHKGTPFYFLAIAAYSSGDHERALAFMDGAVDEDHRIHGHDWRNVPSGMFFSLNPEPRNQFGRHVVRRVTDVLSDQFGQVAALGGPVLTMPTLITRLVEPAIDGTRELRSVVTALFTFLLEYQSRADDLKVLPPAAGTGEAVYLHLFKGALLFETLLKTSVAGQAIIAGRPRATLGDLLASDRIYQSLGFRAQPQGPGGDTFDDVLQLIREEETNREPFNVKAVHAVWGVRNKTGHSLAWPRKPSEPEYSGVFRLVLGAIVLVLANLY
jgi:hypothetical protein